MEKLTDSLHSAVSFKDNNESGRSELWGSVFFVFISVLLTVLNIVKQADIYMTVATSVLAVGFSVVAVLASSNNLSSARILILVLCGAIFTMFAVTGGNDGFAILWILLVPIVGALWIGLKLGIILSVYFLVFLGMLFYTPVSEYVKDYYTPTFMLRFPLLYLASFGASLFLLMQREKLIGQLHHASYYDALTGLYNRRYYNEQVEKYEKKGVGHNFCSFSFDLNRLKYVNDNFGHSAGDVLIKAAADVIKDNFKGADCFRTGGDEFVVFADGIDAEKALSNMNSDISKWKDDTLGSLSISAGYAKSADNPELSFTDLIKLADDRMYEEKDRYHEENGITDR